MLRLLVRRRLLVAAVMTAFTVTGTGWASTTESAFYQGYYLEEEVHDYAAAAKLYDVVVSDAHADPALKSQAQARLAVCREELACADFADLMPRDTLVYLELNRPADQLVTLLEMAGLMKGRDVSSLTQGKQVAVSPELVEAAMGIRGAAVAITGFDPFNQDPMGVAVFHPGDVEMIRGLLETSLPVGGSIVEPVGGFPTYNIEGEVFITLTSRLVVASPQRALIDGVVQRLKGEQQDSLANNAALADALEDRDDALLYFCVNAKPIMPMLNAIMAGAGSQNQELAIAQAVLDLRSLRTLVGGIGVSDAGLFFELQLSLDEGHHNLVYNLLRTPPIQRDTLRCVPEGVAAFIVGALNAGPAKPVSSSGVSGDRPPVVTALDFGREVFANITSFVVFVLPPEEEAAGGPPIPDVAAVFTVNDPAKSRALWTQMLGIGSLASGAGTADGYSDEIEGVATQSFAFPDHVMIHFATAGNDVLIATSKSAVARSLQAKRARRSVLDDAAFAASLTNLGAHTTQALFAHPGRCMQIAKPFMGANELAEMKPVMGVMQDTVVSAVVDHSDGLFRVSALLSGIPDVGELVASMLAEEGAKQKAHSALTKNMKEKNWDGALEVLDGLLAKKPNDLGLLQKKFRVLAVGQKDREAALACADLLYQNGKQAANFLNNFAWALLTEDRYGGEYRELALKFSKRSNKLTKHKNWAYVDTLARAKFETGDVEEAIELQKKAMGLSNGAGMEEMKTMLARYEKASQRSTALAESE